MIYQICKKNMYGYQAFYEKWLGLLEIYWDRKI